MTSRYTLHANRSAPLDDTVQLADVMSSHQFSDHVPVEPASEVVIRQTDGRMEGSAPAITKWQSRATVAILLAVNLLNYMDRFTIAGEYFLSLF